MAKKAVKKYVCPYCKEKGETREISTAGMRMHVATKHPEKLDAWLKSKNTAKPSESNTTEGTEKVKEGGDGAASSKEDDSFRLPELLI